MDGTIGGEDGLDVLETLSTESPTEYNVYLGCDVTDEKESAAYVCLNKEGT